MDDWIEDRDHIIDEEWESLDAILESVKDRHENPLEEYGFDDATEFINYVSENYELDQGDIARVNQYLENSKCPYCEEDNLDDAVEGDVDDTMVDPTLESHNGQRSEDTNNVDYDEKITFAKSIACGNHHEEAYLLLEQTEYQ